MTPSEILEFLELTPQATNADIQRRALEKKAFFEQLQQSAPNSILKNLHTRNLEKTLEILSTMKVTGQDSGPQPPAGRAASPFGISEKHTEGRKSGEPVGYLIRHTEGMATRSFPLFEGKNVVGRERHPQYPTIALNDDTYISRQHAVIEIEVHPVQVYVTDGLGKPSKNGTYINGNENAITRRTKLHSNDTIQAGMTKFILKINEHKELRKLEDDVAESDYMKTVIINI